MIYIQKDKEPDEIVSWKKKFKNKNKRKPCYEDIKSKPEKQQLKEALLHEQKYLCCYCCNRISDDSSHIEHFVPQSKDSGLSLEYSNLHASCQGENGDMKHCGHAKGNDYDKALYVTSYEQVLHFRQIFEVAKLLGLDEKYIKGLEHVSYGMVLLETGKMSTREGNVVKLEDLLNEAIERAKKVIEEKNPDLENKDDIAKKVGIGAVVFNDLANSRVKDEIFNWDKVLNFQGETGPYIQYTYVRTQSVLEKIEEIDSKYSSTIESLRNIYYEMQEISRDIETYCEDVDFDEQQREEVETRLDIIYDLKRKYGNNIEEILEYGKEVADEINKIENAEEINAKLRKEKAELETELNVIAMKISEIRKKYATELNQRINKELLELEMKNATINVKVEYKTNEYFENGKDSVQIYIRTNIGENESELVKIASGGEMSRIMLAIKKVIAEADEVPVMIFDEIDTGISGKAANAVADKMKSISKNHQVLCISHLAAIAASANYNYFISKKVENERTATKVKLLNEKEVLCEIARISSGEVNEVTLQYANELRKKVS